MPCSDRAVGNANIAMQTVLPALTPSARMLQGALGAISYVRGLRVLRIEDLHCRLETEAVMDLGALAQVCYFQKIVADCMLTPALPWSRRNPISVCLMCGCRSLGSLLTWANKCLLLLFPSLSSLRWCISIWCSATQAHRFNA